MEADFASEKLSVFGIKSIKPQCPMRKINNLNFFGVTFIQKDNKFIIDRTCEVFKTKKSIPRDMQKTAKMLQSIYKTHVNKEDLPMIRKNLIKKIRMMIKVVKEKTEKVSKCYEMCNLINSYIDRNHFLEGINYYEILPRKLKHNEIDYIYDYLLDPNIHMFKIKDIEFLKLRIFAGKETIKHYEEFEKIAKKKICTTKPNRKKLKKLSKLYYKYKSNGGTLLWSEYIKTYKQM